MKKILALLCATMFLCLCAVSSLAGTYEHDIEYQIAADKDAYGPAIYHTRAGHTSSTKWHAYLTRVEYSIDPGSDYPYNSGDLGIYVYCRTTSKVVSGTKSMAGINIDKSGTGYDLTNLTAAAKKNNSEFKVVTVRNNSSIRGFGLIVGINWQPYE